MRAFDSKSPVYRRSIPQLVLSIVILTFFLVTPAALAQSGREQVEGVKNFGRVTDRYFRGGAVTPTGIESLAAMGVRTIIDLRDNPNADEPMVCQRNGVRYFNFPMTGHDTPDDKAVNEILSIIQNAKEPVYVHCSAGKHRAGTIAALYRTRVQGWSPERAWAEQQSYGFGNAEGHPQLHAYVYGRGAKSGDLETRAATDNEHRDKVGGKNANPDSDEAEIAKALKKEGKLAKSKKKKDDDDDDAGHKKHGDKGKDKKKKDKDKGADVAAMNLP